MSSKIIKAAIRKSKDVQAKQLASRGGKVPKAKPPVGSPAYSLVSGLESDVSPFMIAAVIGAAGLAYWYLSRR